MKSKHLWIPVVAALVMIITSGSLRAQAGTAIIGGCIFTGSQNPDGTPDIITAASLSDASVMVQNQHSGGAFITYGAVGLGPDNNCWEATVPAPGDYVIMFSAPDHDATSREVTVDDSGRALHPKRTTSGITMSTDPLAIDAYLPPLFTALDGTPDPANELPTANLMVYAFYDNTPNGEPDDYPEDIHLNGVEFTVRDEEGNVLATGVTGTQTPITLSDGTQMAETDGLYYFTGLPPGEFIVTSDPKYVCNPAPGQRPQLPELQIETPNCGSDDFYLDYTEEGGPAWEVNLYSGDPGTEEEAGGFLVWHGYVEKLGQINAGNVKTRFGPRGTLNDAGSISGVMMDADATLNEALLEEWDFEEEEEEDDEFLPVPGQDHPGVTPNTVVPDGLIILFLDQETSSSRPVAVIEADPVTGEFTFENVPPGRYKMMSFDISLYYVWTQQQVMVYPNQDVVLSPLTVLVPRFGARGRGYVYDNSTGLPVPGATVHIRYKDGSIQMTETTDATGWYNFEFLPEIEVLGHVDVELPPNYRGAVITETFYPEGSPLVFHEDTNGNGVLDPGEDIFPNNNGTLDHYICQGDPNPYPGVYTEVPCNDITHNAMNRYIQWYTLNYRADLYLEPIPEGEGDIRGVVFNDHLARGDWTGDGLYDPHEERTMHGVTIELWNADGTTLITTTTTGEVDKSALRDLGWIPAYSTPPDEFGGVFVGPMPGFYEFRGLAPGTYKVKVIPPAGFSPSSLEYPLSEATVTVTGGLGTDVNFGINTLVPLAGEIEGGVWDDLFVDSNPTSTMFEEKAGIPGAPVGVYDHLGYLLGVGYQGDAYCNPLNNLYHTAGDTTDPFACSDASRPEQKPEMERRFAPGVHIYVGNDPAFPVGHNPNRPLVGFNPNYPSLVLPYTFGQGKYKFEADWSLLPGGWLGPSVPLAGDGPILPEDGPEIEDVAPVGSYLITGHNFGDEQGYSTVTLSGRELDVISWSDTAIHVETPPDAVSGPLLVTTSKGPSNAVYLDIGYTPPQAVFVDANNTGPEDGSQAHPWNTIGEAMDHLPAATPRYVFVAPGTYNERIWVKESDIYIIGAGPLETTINGRPDVLSLSSHGLSNGGGPVFYIGVGGGNSWEGRETWCQAVENVMISGFTITGSSVTEDDRAGYEIGAGIFGDYGNRNIDINNNVIVRNGGYYGGGIWLHKSNHGVRIWSNTIAENGNHGGYSGGISVNDEPFYPEYFPESGPRAGMRMTEAHGEPEHVWDDSCEMATTLSLASSYKKIDRDPGCEPWGAYEIYNNHIFHNFSPDYGGGISLYEIKDHLKVFGNLIEDNWADDHGGGAFFEDTGPIDIYGNTFLRNCSRDDGGAISFEDVGDDIARVRIYNNLFAENIADDCGENTARGGALAFDDTFYVKVINNTIVGNIVAGSRNPAGGGIDSERHGHEYNHDDPDGSRYVAPGYSDPWIKNNIIWGNMRLDYNQPLHKDEEDLCYDWGKNYRWSPDDLHVDNPALQEEWESYNNSESFTLVQWNDISDGGYSARVGNISADPQFVASSPADWYLDPDNSPVGDWHLQSGSPAIDQAYVGLAPENDLGRHLRSPKGGMVDMGAYEFQWPHPGTLTIVKDANPADGTNFSFGGDLGYIGLDDAVPDDGDWRTDTKTYAGLRAGTYTVTEEIPSGWLLLNVECSNNDFDLITDTNNNLIGMAVHLEESEDVTCTFTNDDVNPAIQVIKEASVTTANVGETVTYTYTVTNIGDVTLTGISAIDDRLGSISLISDTLTASEVTSATTTYIVRESDLPGPLASTVTVTGTPPVGPHVTATDDTSISLASNSAIQVVKEASVTMANVGETITYTYTITNNGDVTLTGVSATDDRLGSITLNATTLSPGESAVGTATYLVQPSDLPGPLTSIVTVSGIPPVGPVVTTIATDVTPINVVVRYYLPLIVK